MLDEAGEDVRELTADEETRLFASVRDDYEPWLRFALTSGFRLAETILRWSDVHWEADVITTIGEGGRAVMTPLYPALRELLEPLKGHHAEFVFTYVRQKPNVAKRGEKGRQRGERYPLTYFGIRSEWRSMCKRASITNFRIHDAKHDTLTKVNRIAGLKVASRAGNHSDTNTRGKYYSHAHDAEVADALQRIAKARVPKTYN